MCILYIVEPAKYSTYDVRVRAVKAVLMGQRKIDVAIAYQVDYSTLYRWCQRCIRQQDFSELERKSGSGRPNILDFNHLKLMSNNERIGFDMKFPRSDVPSTNTVLFCIFKMNPIFP